MRKLMSLVCQMAGHDFSPEYSQPDPPFEKVWNQWLLETCWMEVFLQDCRRCRHSFKIWRWTRAAAAKMVEDDLR